MTKKYTVIADVQPVGDGLTPVLLDDSGHRYHGQQRDYVQVSDGQKTGYAEWMEFCGSPMDRETAEAVASKHGGTVVPVIKLTPGEIRAALFGAPELLDAAKWCSVLMEHARARGEYVHPAFDVLAAAIARAEGNDEEEELS
jgi:hypothetical protein